MALRAKLKFETDVFFMILRSKIMKNTSVSKEYSAAEGGKTFLHNPKIISRDSSPLNRYKFSKPGRFPVGSENL
ncbi:MAG: hypothetical protein RL386_2178 [Bacteroidota bacterium]